MWGELLKRSSPLLSIPALLCQFVLFFVEIELFFKERIALVNCTGRFVQVEVVVCGVDDATCNVGAVVGDTLKVGE